jgi:hypothetical protein
MVMIKIRVKRADRGAPYDQELDIDDLKTIQDVKDELEAWHSANFQDQLLYLDETLLQDTQILRTARVVNGSEIALGENAKYFV